MSTEMNEAQRVVYNAGEAVSDEVKREFPHEYVIGLGLMRMRTRQPLVSL